MASVKDVARDFARCVDSSGPGALRSVKGIAYSYGAQIAAHRSDGSTWITSKRYSVTTSKHCNAIADACAAVGRKVVRAESDA